MQVMCVYEIQRGPFQSPVGQCKWLDVPLPGWYLGKLHIAPCPVCQGDNAKEYLEKLSGLKDGDRLVSLEGFRFGGVFSGKTAALTAARCLLAQNQKPNGFLTFVGEYGVGKSHLLKAITNGFVRIGVPATYRALPDLLEEIKERFGEQHAAAEVVEYYRQVRVLCLDEIDKVQLTDWTRTTVFRLLDARASESASLLTVMASNLAPESYPADLGYLVSRINGGGVVKVDGPDMRPPMGIAAKKKLAEDYRAEQLIDEAQR
jgi:DNA replication protein DnaC